jgi:predicted pyridoxine 5'-phosphate oxidase superfamily flavin-nucleotide-binding protein
LLNVRAEDCIYRHPDTSPAALLRCPRVAAALAEAQATQRRSKLGCQKSKAVNSRGPAQHLSTKGSLLSLSFRRNMESLFLQLIASFNTYFKFPVMKILTPEIKEFVKRVKLGFIATVCPDGTPNLSPKGTLTAWDDQHLVFADIHSPGTIKNLLVNPAIEINVVDVFIRKGYRFKGTAKVLSEGTLFNVILSFYNDSTRSNYVIKNVVMVKVDQVLPVYSPAYDSETEEQIVKRWTEYWSSVYGSSDSSRH